MLYSEAWLGQCCSVSVSGPAGEWAEMESPDEAGDSDCPSEREGDGEGIGRVGREFRYEQGRLAVAQLPHTGRDSSHFEWRCLHSLQPYLDFR